MRATTITLILAATTATLFSAACSGASEERKLFDETTKARCTVCHGPNRWEGKQFTPEQWKEIVDRMITHGAKLSDEEYKRILVGPAR